MFFDQQNEKYIDNMFYVIQQLLKRGARVDLGVMSFRDNQGDNPHLRKQRIGDQKDLINCLRDGEKVADYYKISGLVCDSGSDFTRIKQVVEALISDLLSGLSATTTL